MYKFTLLDQVGKGSYGSVWKAYNNETERFVALKSVKVRIKVVRDAVEKEIKLLEKISTPTCHPFLTCIYSHFTEARTIYIEMEFIDGVTLGKFAKGLRLKNQYEELYRHLIALVQDVIKGIRYLHEQGIIHRDIKPENIMIDKAGVPKVIDIGLGCFADELCAMNEECCLGAAGTPYFMAPETLLDSESFFVSDIWGLGATLYYSATGENVYNPDPPSRNVLKILVQTEDPPKLITGNTELNELVNAILVKDVNRRPNAVQVELFVSTSLIVPSMAGLRISP